MANNIILSFVAHEAITEYALVSSRTDGKVQITDAGSEAACLGIAQRACSAGDVVDVLVSGVSRAIAGAAIANLSTTPLLMATTDGKLIAHATTGNYSVAQAIPNINQTSAAGAGEQILVRFTSPQNLIP